MHTAVFAVGYVCAIEKRYYYYCVCTEQLNNYVRTDFSGWKNVRFIFCLR